MEFASTTILHTGSVYDCGVLASSEDICKDTHPTKTLSTLCREHRTQTRVYEVWDRCALTPPLSAMWWTRTNKWSCWTAWQFPAHFKHDETPRGIYNPFIDGGREERTARFDLFGFMERVPGFLNIQCSDKLRFCRVRLEAGPAVFRSGGWHQDSEGVHGSGR